MVSPLFPAIGRATVAVWAKFGRTMGWGVSRTAAAMVGAGQGYRRTEMLGHLRSHMERERVRPAALSVPKKYHPTASLFAESPYNIKAQYQVGIEFRGISTVSGERVTHTVYLEYDKLPTVAEMEQAALAKWGEEYAERIEAEWEEYQFTGGFRRA